MCWCCDCEVKIHPNSDRPTCCCCCCCCCCFLCRLCSSIKAAAAGSGAPAVSFWCLLFPARTIHKNSCTPKYTPAETLHKTICMHLTAAAASCCLCCPECSELSLGDTWGEETPHKPLPVSLQQHSSLCCHTVVRGLVSPAIALGGREAEETLTGV